MAMSEEQKQDLNENMEEIAGEIETPKERRSYSLHKQILLLIVNTFFLKKMEHIVTYKSGGRMSVIDYILIRRNNISKVKDCKVIPGESIATQHRILTMDICIQTKKRVKTRGRKQQIKWWRLKDRDENRKFASKVEENIEDIKEWNQLEALLLDTAKSVLGQTTGKGAYNEKEAWLWNEEVQKAVKEKRLKFKQYQQSRCDEDKDDFREANKRAKRGVAKAKESAYKDLYDKLDSIDGQKMIYKLSKTRERRTRDLTDIAYINDSNGTILTDEDEIKARWKESFETLLNVENEREELEPTDPVQGPIPSVNDAEIKKQLSKTGRNKACGPDDLPIEAIMVIAELKPELLTHILQQIMANGIPDSWKKSKLIPIFKNKGDILECNNYRGIKLMSHFMKLWERIIEARLREIVMIRDNQFGFRPGMSTTEPVFALRQLQEKCREKNNYLHMVFVDVEKAFDRIPRDLIWWCLRKKGVPEEYVQIVQDMYRSCKTQVVTQKGETEYFQIEVGLHQGSALSPLLFIIIMDVLTENIEKDPPWAMMFADDLVLCAMTREEVEEDLETRRVVFERHGLMISRTKTEYLPSPTNDTETTVKLVDAELPTVTSFKYIGSLFTSEGGSQADVNNRIIIGWMKWKEVSGVMCDRKMPVELKDKLFKTIIRPAMTYGSECWAVKKKDESKLNSAEMRMLRWARGKTRLDHIRNEDIRKEAHVKPVETFLENKRLKWFGHCLRREPNHICAKSLILEVSGRRSRGRPRKRWRDNIQGDMKKYRLTEDMAHDRKYWMTQILAGPAQGDGQER